MTQMFDLRSFVGSVKNLFLARAAAKVSSWNGFGCGRDVRPLQELVRVWTGCAVACPGVRWHVKLRQEGATLWAFGALAANDSGACVRLKCEHELNLKY
jgi:hypothetical protein